MFISCADQAIKTFDWILHVLKLFMVLTLLLIQSLKAEICVKVDIDLNIVSNKIIQMFRNISNWKECG
jgi:hypothetical protein